MTDTHAHARAAAADVAYPDSRKACGSTDWAPNIVIQRRRDPYWYLPGQNVDMSWNNGSGNCVGRDPDMWFTKPGVSPNPEAIRLCNTCPLVDACREHGIRHEHFGVWGGLTELDRKRERRLRRRDRATVQPVSGRKPGPILHGSAYGYRQHLLNPEHYGQVCDPCRRAAVDASRKAKQRAAKARLTVVDG